MELTSKLLAGKVALVTGSSRGIGKAIVQRFAAAGANVYANCRTEGSFEKESKELSAEHQVQVVPLYYDVTDTQAAKSGILRIIKEREHLDILVNNAGIMEDVPLGMITEPLVNKVFAVNVYAVIEHLQIASRIMRRRKTGSIINISSIVGANGASGQCVYSASKGAVIALTKSAAKELAYTGIRVNAIAPGMIDTDMYRSIGEKRMQEQLKMIGMGRFGTSQDVANMALFLASDLSLYVTGQVLGVDGGALV